MKFLLANWGSRGEVEPCVSVGRELLRRGHDVRIAIPPDLIGFAEAAGIPAVAYGPELNLILDPYRNFWICLFRTPWRIRRLSRLLREVGVPLTQRRKDISTTLMSLADGADLILTGMNYEDVAANVAEYYDIPVATLHYFPMRANNQLLPFLPAPLGRFAMTAFWWLHWRTTRKTDDEHRRELGLPRATGPWFQRIAERGSLEIQAYDEVCFPGLAAEWAGWNGRRPFVGVLTMELATDTDEEVASWVKSGTPPIFFGFGSIPVDSAADTIAMISSACAQLGERALVCSGGSTFTHLDTGGHVKVVDTVNFAAIFPSCRAVVHHGGSGTTAAGLRAGLPTLILWTAFDQRLWGVQVKRLKVGTARRFSTTTLESLVGDLRRITSPQCVARAREIASQMTKPTESVSVTADLVEDTH